MFQPLIGTIKTNTNGGGNDEITIVSTPYRDDKNFLQCKREIPIETVSTPYRDDKNKYKREKKTQKLRVSTPYRDDKNLCLVPYPLTTLR